MSAIINLTQNTRPYKIEVYGLQDNYIGCLQSFSSEKGQIISPQLSISDDGTQQFSCEIPMYYIDEASNERKENPRWRNEDKLLAENTRVLKVFIETDDGMNIYPLIVTSLEDKRDNNFQAIRHLTADGLAFQELGKIGYKLEFGWDLIQAYLKKHPDENITTNIQYWLDQIFPNKKDEKGNIIKWLTPWCYEIRMDWRGYLDAANRESTVIYDDSYVADWIVKNGKLEPAKIAQVQEKCRVLEVKGSNKYNICNSLAELFEVFCAFEYKCSDTGRFIYSYTEGEKQWMGRKVIFYNKAIDQDNPMHISYQENLNTITRKSDSTEIYTKLYVNPVQSETMTNGYITIADAAANPTMDEFILNFDYLKEVGSITEFQYEELEKYKAKLREINQKILQNQVDYSNAQILSNQASSDLREQELKLQACNETLEEYEKLYNNEVINTPVQRNGDNVCELTAVPKDEGNCLLVKIGLDGVDAATVGAFIDGEYKKVLFAPQNVNYISSQSQIKDTDNCFSVILDNYGFATHVAVPKKYITSLAEISVGFKASTNYTETKFSEIISLCRAGDYVEAKTKAEYSIQDKNSQPYPEEIQMSTFRDKIQRLIFYHDANESAASTGSTYLDYLSYSQALNVSGALSASGGVLWLQLTFLPKNKYAAVYSQATSLRETLTNDLVKKTEVAQEKAELVQSLADAYDALSSEKEELNADFESLMGPALREGYWTPSDYSNINQTITDELHTVTWDEIPFDGEQLPYYLISDNLGQANKHGYYYMDVTDILQKDSYANQNAGTLCLHFRRETYKGQLDSDTEKLSVGWYSVTIDGAKKYFSLENVYVGNSKYPVKLKIDKNLSYISVNSDKYSFQYSYPQTLSSAPPDITSMFEYLGNEIFDCKMYEGAGIKLSFVKKDNLIRIIAIILNEDLITDLDGQVVRPPYGYSVLDKADITRFSSAPAIEKFAAQGDGFTPTLVYPRIILEQENIQYNSTSLIIKPEKDQEVILKNYYSYNVWLRALKDSSGNDTASTRPHITLKICSSVATTGNDVYQYYNYPTWILAGKYYLSYEISRANDDLYIDASEVALDNSYPNYSYSLSVANIPGEIRRIKLGQMVYINDFLLGLHRVSGYISKITYKLDQPQTDEIEIKNYNTKFEDLFSTISASSEAMKVNEHSYNIAASKFASGSTLAEDVQESLNSISLGLTTGQEANVQLNDVDGMLLVDKVKNENDVYGMIALRSGGIFTSDSVDNDGDRIWKSVITSGGINASYIKAGQIDTNLIRIMSGSNPAFQWNSEGLFAYDSKNPNRYISYNSEGLKLNEGGTDKVEVSWDGFIIRNKSEDLFWVDEDGNLNIKGRIVSGSTIGDNNTAVDKISQNAETYSAEIVSQHAFVCNISNVPASGVIDTLTAYVYKGNVLQDPSLFQYRWCGQGEYSNSNTYDVEYSTNLPNIEYSCEIRLNSNTGG